MTYNVLNLEGYGSDDSERLSYIAEIIVAIDPDLVVLQELIYEEALDSVLEICRAIDPGFESAEFFDGYNTDNGLVYNGAIATLIEQTEIETDLRNISEYVLEIDSLEFRIYSCHLKASYGNDNVRLSEVQILREHLNALPDSSVFIVCGDMNFYGAYEPAYQKFLADEADNSGRLYDPLDPLGAWIDDSDLGYWNNNHDFAGIHSQSTRVRMFAGGASGGLDDRFDMILNAENMRSLDGFEFVEGSYRSFGNDGEHFNDSINAPPYDEYSHDILNALHYASDHLPVVADYRCLRLGVGESPKPTQIQLDISVRPNPFNSAVEIAISGNTNIDFSDLDIEIFDINGKRIDTPLQTIILTDIESSDPIRFIWQPAPVTPTGVYLVRISGSGERAVTKRVVFVQ